MKKLTKDELNKIIENHSHWLRKDCDGWENMRADLSWTDLLEADLSEVDLSRANLFGANLSWVNLSGANLLKANLSRADLFGANLSKADLFGANLLGANLLKVNLSKANLSKADLSMADLFGADLIEANLSMADLSRTDLSKANLFGANLLRTNLSRASLSGANLSGTENTPYIPIACPDTGAFVAWKKVNDYIVKLQIPEDAKRCSATTRKCRCDKALVLAIENKDGTDSGKTTLTNMSYATCVYTVGKMVYPDSWDDDRWNECSHGIHFFITRQEAVDW